MRLLVSPSTLGRCDFVTIAVVTVVVQFLILVKQSTSLIENPREKAKKSCVIYVIALFLYRVSAKLIRVMEGHVTLKHWTMLQ